MTTKPKNVLFVCVGNSCRSQMAEALARKLAPGVIQPVSAGLVPLATIAELTRRVLREHGAGTDGQYPKGLAEANPASADLIVNMTGIPGKALFPEATVLDWDVEDPFEGGIVAYRRVCDEIQKRVTELAASFRANRPDVGAT